MKIISSLLLCGVLSLGFIQFQESDGSEKTKATTIKSDIPAPSNCKASPYVTDIIQADGSTISIIGKGNMNNSWTETSDGYTILEVNGIYEYAQKVNGNLQATGVKANNLNQRSSSELNFVSTLQKSLKPKINPLKSSILNQVNAQLGNKTFPTTGSIRVLALLIDYPDLQNTYTKANFDSLLSGLNYRNGDGSFKTYYETASGGQLTVTVDVMGWYTAANGYLFYGRDSGSSRAANLVREAVDAAELAGANFANYDNDNDGSVDGILAIHAGPGAEQGSRTQYIWSHRWVLNGGSSGAVTYDGKFINDYMINPETRTSGANSNQVGIGVFVHEFGHNLGLPDLYDTDPSNGDSEGIGNWCVMAGGSWLGGEHRPINFSAWCRIENGWETPQFLTIGNSLTDTLDASSTQQNEIRRINTGVASEYFLLENRQKTGLDLELPGSGMAVWHINTIKTNGFGNGVNADEDLKGVDLEEADGNNDLDHEVNRGDAGDLFPGSSNNTTFDDNSNPNARNYSLASTNIQLRNIQEKTGQIIYDFGPQLATPSCSGGTVLMAGSGTFNDGSNATTNYSNDLNCSWLIQPTGVASISLNFTRFDVDNFLDRVAVYDGTSFSAPLIGTYTGTTIPPTITSTGGALYIEFTTNPSITALGWEATYTSTGLGCAGATTNLTAPSGNFSDGSGAANYANNTSCSWLIQPSGVSSITFGLTSLATEINNDRIRIYDGIDNTAPQIASYSGTNHLNTTTSSGGSMFVEFTTNATVVDAGWDAYYTSSVSGAGCSGSTTLTATSGSFSDGSGVNNYDNNQFCSWLIQPPSGVITLNFTAFDTEANFDRVIVFDGVDNTAPQIGNFSGSTIPAALISSSNAMYIEFRTNGSVVNQGWDANYTAGSPPSTCSGNTNLSANTGTFDDGSGVNVNYSNNLNCSWAISIPTASVMSIAFDSIAIAAGDTVFIYDGSNATAPLLGKYSGYTIPAFLLTSTNNAYVEFKSNANTNDEGWQITYTGVNGCSGTTNLNAVSGTFSDGTQPGQQYFNNSNCQWLIQPPGANFITLDFNRFDTEQNFDFVEVYDGATTASTSLGRFDGNTIPPSIISSSGSLLVVFTSDISLAGLGWEARYNSSTTKCLQNRLYTSNNGSFSDGSGALHYDNNSNCSWLIQPALATNITLTFSAFDTESANDVVNIYDGIDNTGTLVASYSGSTIPAAASVNGTNKSMFVEFITNGSITAQGWDASYTSTSAVTCSGVTNLTAASASFSDGSGTGVYDNNLNCGWLIQPTGGAAVITLTMNTMALADFNDRVRVYDGVNNSANLIGNFFFNNTGNPVSAYSGSMFVEFTTNATGQGQGWDATYTSSNTYCTPLTVFTNNNGNFTDGSPLSSNYLDNTDCQWLIQPTATNIAVRITFFQFNTEAGFDTVTVYDGTTTADPILGTFSGSLGSIPAITSSGGDMLVTFKTDGNTTGTGWRAFYSTQTIPNCVGLTTLNAATGTFDDGSLATANYIENSNCQWLIQPTGASLVSLTFNRFSTQAGSDFVRVYDGSNNSAPLIGSYSGNALPPSISSTGSSLFVEFTTNGFNNQTGWEATYNSSSAQCFTNLTLTSHTDTIEDGSKSLNYQNNLNCSWLIQPNTAIDITLTFLDFNVNNLGDTLIIYDGSNASAPVLAKYTGNSLPAAITSTGNSMFVEFNTDGSTVDQGWKAVYTITSSLSCVGTTNLTAPSGTFSDGSGTAVYDNNLACGWLIQPPGNPAVIVLNMTSMNLANFGDRVRVYDGVDNSGTIVGSFFGSNIGNPVSAYSGSMFVEFITDGNQQGQGWDANYSSSFTYCAPSTTFTANNGNFTDGSPNGTNYLNNTSCEWLIQPAATNVAVSLRFFQFNTEAGADTVTVYDGVNSSAPILATYSGNLGTTTQIVSSGGSMFVTFKSDASTTASGWRAIYNTQTIPFCSGTTNLTAASGTFSDGSANGVNYVQNSNCEWLIQPAGGAVSIDLNFNYFNTEANFDFVTVYNGSTVSAPVLGTFSGTTIPGTITATGGSMLVVFTSDQAQQANGWEASYTSSNVIFLDAVQDTITINAGAGSTGSISVNSNSNWSTSDNATWLIVSPLNGSHNQSINALAIQPNIGPKRYAKAYINAQTGIQKDSVVIVQRASGNFLSANPDTLYFAANPSASQNASIVSSVSWNLTPSQSWITSIPNSGNNNGSSAVSVSQNTNTAIRFGHIVVSGNLGVANDTIFVKQDAAPVQPPSLSVSPSNLSLNQANGSSGMFTVNSTVQWQTSSGATWLTVVNPANTFDTNTVMISANSANASPNPRSSFVAVQDIAGTLFDTVFVSQLGLNPSLDANPDTVYLGATAGSVGNANITSNQNWNLTIPVTWVNANLSNGTGNAALTFTANADNNTGANLISYAAISDASNSLFDTIFIVQDFIKSTGGVTTNPDTIRLAAAMGSSNTFSVIASSATSWTSTPDASWINLSSTNGTGSKTITVTANSANLNTTERMTFIVTSDASLPIPDTVFVIQEGTILNFSVSPNNLSLNFNSGSNGQVNVSSTVNWTISNPVTWLTLSTSSGSNNGVVTITANSDNLSGINRTANLSFDAAGLPSQLVTVTQVDGSGPNFSLSVDTVFVGNPQGSTATFSVLSNIQGWTLSENTPWLLVNPISGNNVGLITVLAASRNNYGTPRTAIIRSTAPGFPNDSVVVIQKETTPLFQVAPKNVLLGVNKNDQATFNISSNLINWVLTENASWMDVSTTIGGFTQTVVITATDTNNTGNVRLDSIVVSSPPLVPQTVYVTQDTIRGIGIETYDLTTNLSVYPNPNTGSFYIQSEGNKELKDANIQVFDMLGKMIKFNVNAIDNHKVKLELNTQSEGIYFVQFILGNERVTRKITLVN